MKMGEVEKSGFRVEIVGKSVMVCLLYTSDPDVIENETSSPLTVGMIETGSSLDRT